MKWKIISLLVLLFIPLAYADGCCTNPNSNFEFAICQQVPEQICCGDDTSCASNYFHEGQPCYSSGSNSNFQACDIGCCCEETNDGVIASIVPQAACSGDFQQGITDLQTCADNCGGEQQLTPYVDTGNRQCMYYYCSGNTIPQGPMPSEQGSNLVYVEAVYENFKGRVTAAIETADHYWLVNETGGIYLYDSDNNLESQNLQDYGILTNPTNIQDVLNGVTEVDSMSALRGDPAGKIFLSQQSTIYEYDGSSHSSIASTSSFNTQSFDSMSTYGSLQFNNYFMMLGYDNQFNVLTSTSDNPFSDYSGSEILNPLVEDIDAVLELNYDDSFPCLIFFGKCTAMTGCTEDSHCTDFNECTTDTCDNGICSFSPVSDGTSCANGECCSGLCYENPVGSDYHESCRTGPTCQDHFLKFEAANDGQNCEGECKACSNGVCVDNDDLCPSGCCDNGQCGECQDECSSGEISCVSESSFVQCVEQDGFWTFSSEVEGCETPLCYEPSCSQGNCASNLIPSGEEDPNGCYGDVGCDGDNCKCNGNGHCVAMCTHASNCDDNNPCTTDSCNTNTGQCEHTGINGAACNKNGEQGVCQGGDCEIPSCTSADDCPQVPCTSASCDSNTCTYSELGDGSECIRLSGDVGECNAGDCEYIECTQPGDCPGSPCKEKTCENVCTYTNKEDAVACNKDGEDGVCHQGICISNCVEDGCKDGYVCNQTSGICVECLESEDCESIACKSAECLQNSCSYDNLDNGADCDDGFCFQGSCLPSCEDDSQCGGDTPYCSQDLGTCVECTAQSDCDFYDCKNLEGCYQGECKYTLSENGSYCDSCDVGECVCFMGGCMGACYDDTDCTNDPYLYCYNSGVCKECKNDGHCDDGSNCTIDSCEEGSCVHAFLDDGTNCTEDGQTGNCCAGECKTSPAGSGLDEECRSEQPTCIDGEWKFKAVNNGNVCHNECRVCMDGYCEYDNHSLCSGQEICDLGNCTACEESFCSSGEKQCMQDGKFKSCTQLNGCNVWGEPEKCPDSVCKNPGCSNGNCYLINVPRGYTDHGCSGSTGCDSDTCKCDGNGNCAAMCSTDDDCDDQNSCTIDSCSYGTCNHDKKNDGSSCTGGVCCAGVCQTDTGNSFFDSACRFEPTCNGGSYEYSAANEGESCSGECGVCKNGYCYDDSSLCLSGEQCSNGQCGECQNECQPGDTRCANNMVQECRDVNGCMTWGPPEECSVSECTKASCVSGECQQIDIARGKTDSKCYSFHGCNGDNCKCDGNGECVHMKTVEKFSSLDGYKSNRQVIEKKEGVPKVCNSDGVCDSGENSRLCPNDCSKGSKDNYCDAIEDGICDPDCKNDDPDCGGLLWLWILLIVFALTGIAGLFVADRYYLHGMVVNRIKKGAGEISSKTKSMFKQKTQKQAGPKKPPEQQQNKDTYRPTQKFSKNVGNVSNNLQNELAQYVQTLKHYGTDKNKELELMKKGANSEQIQAAYRLARKEKEKMNNRKNMMDRFD